MSLDRRRIERALGPARAGHRRGDPGLRRDLDRLLGSSRRSPAPAPTPHPIDKVVEGDRPSTAAGPLFVARRRFEIPIGTPIDPNGRRLLLPGSGREPIPLDRCLFLDTETTGLAGGTGTLPFLVGVGRFESDRSFLVEQAFLEGPEDEPAQLAFLAEALDRTEVVVTFNGKTFDLPLLETRFRMSHREIDLFSLSHLDLLHPSRRLWGSQLPDCQLSTLEREILGTRRRGDVPGFEIPARYFRFLRSQDARPLEGVFTHNAIDIASLAQLLDRMIRALAGSSPDDHGSACAIGRLHEERSLEEEAIQWYHRALRSGPDDTSSAEASIRLSLLHKRRREWEPAIEIWEGLLAHPTHRTFAAIELAKVDEHRLGRFESALRRVEIALAGLPSDDEETRAALLHRQARLRRRHSASRSAR